MVLCIQNSVFITWITSLYGSQPSSEVFVCKPATFGPKLYVSMGPRTHLWFSACKIAWLAPEYTSLYGSQPSSVVFACKTATFRTQITNLYGSQTSAVSFVQAITAWLAPELIVSIGPSPYLWFLHAKQRLLEQNYKSLWVPDMTCCFVLAKQRNSASELLVSMGPSPHVCFLHAKQRLLDRNNKSLWFPDLTCRFMHPKQRD